jgi:hypothetical protein
MIQDNQASRDGICDISDTNDDRYLEPAMIGDKRTYSNVRWWIKHQQRLHHIVIWIHDTPGDILDTCRNNMRYVSGEDAE